MTDPRRSLWRILTFRDGLRRRSYAVASLAVLIVDHLLIQVAGQTLAPSANILAAHFSLFLLSGTSGMAGTAALAVLQIVLAGATTWFLGALAFARARDASKGIAPVALSILPVLQVPAIIYLCGVPSADPERDGDKKDTLEAWVPAAQGVLVGAVATPVAVAIGALGFGSYGWVMFALSPAIIGAVTAYLANRRTDLGWAQTQILALSAVWLGALALLTLALEGVVCLILASPFVVVLALLGGALGREAAKNARRPVRNSLAAVSILPLAFLLESALPHVTQFQSYDAIEIAAPPQAVWQAITHMGAIRARPALLFRLGVAYPTAGVIRGQGVGAIREGHFSTGVAYEKVTEWSPERRLTFAVLSDAPSLRELSPYPHVYAPHVSGYFRTESARFDLTPLPGGRTRLSLTTDHELDLEPAIYWTPIAKWITHQNKMRVLEHFRKLAEQG